MGLTALPMDRLLHKQQICLGRNGGWAMPICNAQGFFYSLRIITMYHYTGSLVLYCTLAIAFKLKEKQNCGANTIRQSEEDVNQNDDAGGEENDEEENEKGEGENDDEMKDLGAGGHSDQNSGDLQLGQDNNDSSESKSTSPSMGAPNPFFRDLGDVE
jgi:hypothetical protein